MYKKIIYFLSLIALSLPLTAYCAQVTVPQSTAYGQVLIGNQSGGNYTPVATSTLNVTAASILGLIAQGANVTITGNGTAGSPYTISASGGGSGGGTWATTTSQTSSYINYSLNNTDIVTVGGNSTSSAKFIFDPNSQIGYFSSLVGIGTKSPSASLSITGSGVTNPFLIASSSGNTMLKVLSNGNVGINTANPNFNLEVYGTASTTNLYATNATTTNFNTSNISLGANAITYIRGLLSAGTGIGYSGGVITNSAPDQTVVLNNGTNISVTGTYPTFTINATGGGGGGGSSLLLYNNAGNYYNAATTTAPAWFSYFVATSSTATSTFAGSLLIGTTSEQYVADSNQAPLFVDSTNSQYPTNVFAGVSSVNNYEEVYTSNLSNGSNASADFLAQNNLGYAYASQGQSNYYVNFGIDSSGNNTNFFGNANDGYLYASDNALYVGTASTTNTEAYIHFQTQATDREVILANGNVGIGETNPQAKLDVFGVASSTNFFAAGSTTLQNFTFLNATGTNATTTNLFATTASSTNFYGANLQSCNSASNALTWNNGTFGCNSISGASQWTTSGSNIYYQNGTNASVGIGTTSPFALFTVAQPTYSATQAMFEIASTSAGGGATSTPLFIDHNGNVGIGTSSLSVSSSELTINNMKGNTNIINAYNIAGTSEFSVSNTGVGTIGGALTAAGYTSRQSSGGIIFASSGNSTEWNEILNNSARDLEFNDQITGLIPLYISGTGASEDDVGIGATTSPWAMLSIATSTTVTNTKPYFVVSSTTPSVATTTIFELDQWGRVSFGKTAGTAVESSGVATVNLTTGVVIDNNTVIFPADQGVGTCVGFPKITATTTTSFTITSSSLTDTCSVGWVLLEHS